MINNIFSHYRYLLGMAVLLAHADQIAASLITFDGLTLSPIEVTPEKNTGLDCVYVLDKTTGVTASFEAQSSSVKIMRYSNLGGGYAEEINDVMVEGKNYVINLSEGDMGYIIYDGEKTFAFWIVDYSVHTYNLTQITQSSEQGCDATEVDVEGTAGPIHYYTINGRQETLSRDITIEYLNLEWDADNKQFIQKKYSKKVPYISGVLSIMPPIYCNSAFTISGDKFLKAWKKESTVESDVFIAHAVNAMTEAQQESTDGDNSNMIKNDVEGFGGSAPCDMIFNAYTTDALIHYEWQMADDSEFEHISYRINDQDFSYTFTEEGVTYIRFVGSNDDGSCEVYGDTYTVSIGSSELLIPNVFSPNDDGVNDEWKVSYRSLLTFECWIFDMQGHQLFHFTDPSKGWDGKRNGKKVSPGTYYYVIQATGSDGKKYKKSGDINILNYKGSKATSGGEGITE